MSIEIGKKYNMLTCIKRDESKDRRYYIFKCDCGKTKSIIARNVASGATKSCGCRKNPSNTKHGCHGTRIYRIWKNMRERCNNPNGSRANIYYDKGITICDEWDDFISFKNWSLKNGYADNLSLDRINGNGNYEPGNCRWATHIEQANNTVNCVPIDFKGKHFTSQASFERYYGIKRGTTSRLMKKNKEVDYIVENYSNKLEIDDLSDFNF